jgi:ATP-dependent helicase/nuclease subunit A
MNDSTLSDDAAAREAALDGARSFIVQAPAGSGKTELLIQRYLALLAGVERPESIVAMTFTRKAAGEIRERIVEALRKAQTEGAPAEPHEAIRWRLARAVLQRDAALGWDLIAYPARLRIQTIDALCIALMRQAPLTATLGALPKMVERAAALHERAAREELAAARPDDPGWRRVLEYLDNDAGRVVGLMARMLGKREQWLPRLPSTDAYALRPVLEATLRVEIETELAALAALFPRHCVPALLELVRSAVANLTAANDAHPLALVAAAAQLPPATADALAHWRALAEWLLTKKGALRRAVGTAEGFPAAGKAAEAGRRRRMTQKWDMATILAELDAVPGLASALDLVRRLPPPCYDDAAWEFVAALLAVLPRAVARLKLVFAREASIDFAEATLLALQALGDGDAPSDLLLSIDMRVAHLLVDEFQDTSLVQNELIERLTAGWSHGDGRTLFVVGDPMQSIYRFRKADVGLFIAAQQQRRMGGVILEPLTLSRNFRSQRNLVEWVNSVFPRVLAERDDPVRNAVAFKPALATREPAIPAVTVDLCTNPRAEAAVVIDRVREALAGGAEQVAVLVRKRADLSEILPALRSARVAYSAVELDRLSERQATLDLMALTHALIQPDDRLAWLSALRAPWCGLTLHDLFAVVGSGVSFVGVVSDEAGGRESSALSADGRARLARFARAVGPALAQRGRVPLATMVRGVWLALGGPACITDAIDLVTADTFFELLEAHAEGTDVPDWRALDEALTALYAEPDPGAMAAVQIMTLHKAKGLEFDVVIMPALARRLRQPDPELLLWRERPHGLLLAPLKARLPGRDDDALQAYLRKLAKDEDASELGRLLYVGCTRARDRLHLCAVLDVDREAAEPRWKEPASGTSLAALWPALEAQVAPPTDRAAVAGESSASGGVPLVRLPLHWTLPAPPAGVPSVAETEAVREAEMIAFDWARESARQIGVAAHRLLRQMADGGIAAWSAQRVAAQQPRLEREFAALGFTVDEARAAAAQVILAATTTLGDARGRWLFDAGHADARSEFALTGSRDDVLHRVILDRTFVDVTGVRWIVDFKLSRHEGGNAEAFLDSERERYRQQLVDYAQVMRGMDQRPIRLGLYFPLLRGWREWDAPR